MPDVFITLEEAATFEGIKYNTLVQRMKRNPEQYRTQAQAQEGGGKDRTLISTSSLSAKARKAWRAAQKVEGSEVIIDKRAQEAVPWYVTADLNQYTEANKKRFYEAVELAARVQDFIDYDGPDRTGYAERYALGLGISPQSLYRYMKNVLEANAWALKLEKDSFRLRWRLVARFLPLGVCSLLSQISLVASMAAVNNMLRRYGASDPIFSQEQYAQIPMAVVGIVMKFFQIVISIAVGLAAGCIPVVGYNIGAGRKNRARQLFTLLLISEVVVGGVALLIVELFPTQLIALFGAANESVYYTEFAIRSFRIYLCMMIFACVNKGTFIYLQSLGKALDSTLLSMVREVLFGVGFALLLPVFFQLDGVLYSMPVSDVLTFLISAVLIRATYRELSSENGLKREASA